MTNHAETKPTVPTLEEQIARQRARSRGANDSEDAILASLRELQSIRSAEMPVEPEIVQRVMRRKGKELNEVRNPNITARECIELANYINALKSALQVAQQELDKESYLHKLDHSLADQWQERAEKAESELAALLAAPAPEPVAYLMIGISQHDENEPLLFLARELDIAEKYAKDQGVPITPLYTTPPAQDTRRLAELIK